MIRVALCALLLASVAVAQQSDEWITVVYKEDFGSSVTFYCNTTLSSNQPPPGSEPERWMLNDLANIPKSFNDSKYEVSADAWSFTINDVQVEDFGIYHCMMLTTEGEWYLIKLGLNVRGPYYEDLWAKYETNTIIGLSAFFGVLFFGLGIMLIYKNRYIVEEEEEDKEFSKPVNTYDNAPNGHTNAAYVNDGHTNATYVNEKQGLEQEDTTAL